MMQRILVSVEKPTSFCFSVAFGGIFYGWLSAGYGFYLIRFTVDSFSPEELTVFLAALLSGLLIATACHYFLYGLFYRFGRRSPFANIRRINDYIRENNVHTDDESVLGLLYRDIFLFPKHNMYMALFLSLYVVIQATAIFYIYTDRFSASSKIFLGGLSASFIYTVVTFIHTEYFTKEARKAIKARFYDLSVPVPKVPAPSIRLKIGMILLVIVNGLVVEAVFLSNRGVDTIYIGIYVLLVLVTVSIIVGFIVLSVIRNLDDILVASNDMASGGRGHLFISGVDREFLRFEAEYNVAASLTTMMRNELRDANTYKDSLNKSLYRFVPKAFFQYLEKQSIIDIKLGDHIRKEMVIFFLDIVNFTKISEKLSPYETMLFLNMFYENISPIVIEYGGFIDKYIGDSVMALFDGGNSESALRCAIHIARKLDDMNEKNIFPERLSAGIGIHKGRVILGTVGYRDRIDTTVVSDAVNTASRIESMTRNLDAAILFSADILDSVKDRSFIEEDIRHFGRIQFKGKRQSVDVYGIDGVVHETRKGV